MFKEEGYKLMGAAFEVYNQLGYGMAGRRFTLPGKQALLVSSPRRLKRERV